MAAKQSGRHTHGHTRRHPHGHGHTHGHRLSARPSPAAGPRACVTQAVLSAGVTKYKHACSTSPTCAHIARGHSPHPGSCQRRALSFPGQRTEAGDGTALGPLSLAGKRPPPTVRPRAARLPCRFPSSADAGRGITRTHTEPPTHTPHCRAGHSGTQRPRS